VLAGRAAEFSGRFVSQVIHLGKRELRGRRKGDRRRQHTGDRDTGDRGTPHAAKHPQGEFSRVKPLRKPVQEADPDRQSFGMQVSPYDVGRRLRGLPEQVDKMSEVGHLVRCPGQGEIPF
jgi:hypothetical protein